MSKLTNISKLSYAFLVISSALAFYLLCQINEVLFSPLAHSHGVSWIFLPSGLRLLLVLMLGGLGALGVILGSLAIGIGRSPGGDVALAAALISGFAPWLARWVCLRTIQVRTDLNGLSGLRLLQMALVFSVFSAVLHQALYVGVGLSPNFAEGVAVMAIGDLLGALLVIYAFKLALWRPSR